jgi:nitrite reductase (NADH) small subunit
MQNIELSLSSLLADSLLKFEHAGTKLVVVRSKNSVFAFHDRCPHAFWPLSEGTLTNTLLECAGHGWEFDIETGRCFTSPLYCLTPVAVRVDGDVVRLEWPDNLSQLP